MLGAQRVELVETPLPVRLVARPHRAPGGPRRARPVRPAGRRGRVPRRRHRRGCRRARPARPGVSSIGVGVAAIAWARATSAVEATVGRGRRHEVDALLDEVPVGLEVGGHLAQATGDAELAPAEQLHELGGTQVGRDLPLGVVEHAVEEVLPPLVERQLALELVEHGEARRQAGLDGELEQQAAGERVERADRGVVEPVEGGLCRPPSAAPPRSRSRSRWRSSPAAFSVNVMAAMASIGTSASTSPRMRPTRAVVLPAPAPASTNSVVSRSSAMRSRRRLVRRRRSRHRRRGRRARRREIEDVEQARLLRHRRRSLVAVVGSANQRASSGAWRLRSHSPHRTAVPSSSGSQKWHDTHGRNAGRSGRAGNTPASMPATTSSRAAPTRAQTSSSNRIGDRPEVLPEERVPGLDVGGGTTERGPGRRRVDRELEARWPRAWDRRPSASPAPGPCPTCGR